jgi:hypothetical protein
MTKNTQKALDKRVVELNKEFSAEIPTRGAQQDFSLYPPECYLQLRELEFFFKERYGISNRPKIVAIASKLILEQFNESNE